MGKKLPPDQMELYRRVDEILTYLWDPIGISWVPQARDEYSAYLPQVFKRVIDGQSANKIADCLIQFETESIGLNSTIKSKEHALSIAKLLIDHYEWIKQKN